VRDVAAVTKPRGESCWNLLGCPELTNRSQPLVGRSSPYCEDMWRRYRPNCLASFFAIVDTCLRCKDTARQICVMVSRWRILGEFFGSCIFSDLHAAHLHSKFALRPHQKRCFTKHKQHASSGKGGKCGFLSLMTLTFDLWPWPSNLSEPGTKHVFRVNLAQIRSAVPEIFYKQKITVSTKNRTLRSSQRVVKIPTNYWNTCVHNNSNFAIIIEICRTTFYTGLN